MARRNPEIVLLVDPSEAKAAAACIKREIIKEARVTVTRQGYVRVTGNRHAYNRIREDPSSGRAHLQVVVHT